jgi:hypothetical protein
MLEKTGLKIPVFRKTGTTIVGLVFSVCLEISHVFWAFVVSYFLYKEIHQWKSDSMAGKVVEI